MPSIEYHRRQLARLGNRIPLCAPRAADEGAAHAFLRMALTAALTFAGLAACAYVAVCATVVAVLPSAAVLAALLIVLAPSLLAAAYVAVLMLQFIHARRVLYSPRRAATLAIMLYEYFRDLFASGLCFRVLNYRLRRLLSGSRNGSVVVVSDVPYAYASSSGNSASTDATRHGPAASPQSPHGTRRVVDIHFCDPGLGSTASDSVCASDDKSEETDTSRNKSRPVIVFLYGGAWNSGTKSDYGQLASNLANMGSVVVLMDYRRFPEVLCDDMADDVSACLFWVHKNISRFGGDPNRISLLAHSVGTHLAMQAILRNALMSIKIPPESLLKSSGCLHRDVIKENFDMQQAENQDSQPSRKLLLPGDNVQQAGRPMPKLRACVLVSGVFNLLQHYKTEVARGIEYISSLYEVNGASEAEIALRSPTVVLTGLLAMSKQTGKLASLCEEACAKISETLPERVVVMHDENDHVVLCSQSTSFFEAVRAFRKDSFLYLHERGNHVRPIAELMVPSEFASEVFHLLTS